MKIKSLKIITIFFILIGISTTIFAINNEIDGWRVPKGGQIEINVSYAHLIVKNFCTKDVFIPTQNKTEFDYFIANRPNCLERWKCKEEVEELNTQLFCAPNTSIFLSWRNVIELSKSTIGLTYCLLNDSRVVSTPIAPVDYGAIQDALKADIQTRLTQAYIDLNDLQNDYNLGILTDDGVPLKILSGRELAANVNLSYNNGDYNLAIQILDQLELEIIQIPFEGSTMTEVKLEAEANLPRFNSRYAEFKSNYSDVSDFPSSIRDKVNNLKALNITIHNNYNIGQTNYAINNETSRNAFISCLDGIDNGNALINQIKTEIVNTNLAKLNEAKDEFNLANNSVNNINEIYSALNSILNNAQSDIDDAEWYYSIGWENTAYRKAKDAIKETDKIPNEIENIANYRINDAENKLSNLWQLYNDEALNESWIEVKLNDSQTNIDTAQNYFDSSNFIDAINYIDGTTFTLLAEAETDINDQI